MTIVEALVALDFFPSQIEARQAMAAGLVKCDYSMMKEPEEVKNPLWRIQEGTRITVYTKTETKTFERAKLPYARVDMQGRFCSDSLTARLIWQQLFNFYRSNGCSLEHMDNMLVDYTTIQSLIEGGTDEFWWAFGRSGMTNIWTANCGETTNCLHVVVKNNEILFYIQKD